MPKEKEGRFDCKIAEVNIEIDNKTPSQEECKKESCDLINGVYEGTKDESWFCRTHKRAYFPNQNSPEVDNSLEDITHAIMNADTEYDAQRILEKVVTDCKNSGFETGRIVCKLEAEESIRNEMKKEVVSSPIKIVILQRGWVVIGRYAEEETDMCVLTDAYVIRSWGTSEGLGELALEGKKTNTKLDKTGVVRFHKLTSVGIIDCVESKWSDEL